MAKINTVEEYYQNTGTEQVRVMVQEKEGYHMRRTIGIGPDWVKAPSFEELQWRWEKKNAKA